MSAWIDLVSIFLGEWDNEVPEKLCRSVALIIN
jgi:hypothetical protein